MKTKSTIVLLAALFITVHVARADPADDLKARFEQRFPQIVKLKDAGLVGETADGLLDFVKPGDAAAQQLVQAENADRTELYKRLAAKDGTTPEKVATLSGQRHFDKAKPGDWLKGPDGKWKQK